MKFIRAHWWTILGFVVCLGLNYLIGLYYYGTRDLHEVERKFSEAKAGNHGMRVHTTLLDQKFPDVFLLEYEDEGVTRIKYRDGTNIMADGLGAFVMDKDDPRFDKDHLGVDIDMKAIEKHLPVVVFINATGFDASGLPVCMRKASNGEAVYVRHVGNRVSMAYFYPTGEVRVHSPWSAKVSTLTEEQWYTRYMSMSKVEPERKPDTPDIKPDSKPDSKPDPNPYKIKSGLNLKVIRVGGTQGAVVPVEATLWFFRGKHGPKDTHTGVEIRTGKDGTFKLPLTPGVYTLAIMVGTELRGNSANKDVWPSVTVKEDTCGRITFSGHHDDRSLSGRVRKVMAAC